MTERTPRRRNVPPLPCSNPAAPNYYGGHRPIQSKRELLEHFQACLDNRAMASEFAKKLSVTDTSCWPDPEAVFATA